MDKKKKLTKDEFNKLLTLLVDILCTPVIFAITLSVFTQHYLDVGEIVSAGETLILTIICAILVVYWVKKVMLRVLDYYIGISKLIIKNKEQAKLIGIMPLLLLAVGFIVSFYTSNVLFFEIGSKIFLFSFMIGIIVMIIKKVYLTLRGKRS